MTNNIAIACDHGGYELKLKVIEHLKEMGIEYTDFGCNSTDSVDYPDFGVPCAKAVAEKKFSCGILICGTGLGMSICANKVHGIRASICTDTYCAKMTRQHNDANILCMGARVIGEGLALDIVDTFLSTDFLGGRHEKRIEKISNLENE